MILRRWIVEETGCVSYLFGCLTTGDVGVVDPHIDLVGDYVEAAERAGGRIAQVFDTHVHADHVSGAQSLAERTGARLRMPAGSPVELDFEPLEDGEKVELGRTHAQAIATPGHTWEHACLLVADTARSEDPWLVFTGDTLFVGTVGRPDLHGQERELARELHRSIHERLLALPDWVELYPGHVGGSACGAGISSNPSSTIGYERRHSPLLAGEVGGDEFVERVLGELSAPPAEFAEIYERNRRAGPAPARA